MLWLKFASLFISVLCPPWNSVQNGSMTVSTNGTVSSTSFGCDTGYSLKGSSAAVCQADGTWDAVTPTCGKYCNGTNCQGEL